MAEEQGPLSVADAGAAINALMTPEAPKKAPKAKAPKVEAPKAEPKAEPVKEESPYKEDEEPEETPEADPEEEEATPDDQPDAAEEESDEETPPKLTFKVKVDGMEVEVDEDELKKGYSRTADYTRKTQALAEERKKFDAEEAAPLREERRYYAELTSKLEEALEELQPTKEPDWGALRATLDPTAFAERFTEWKQHNDRVQKVRAEKQGVLDRLQQAEQKRVQAVIAAERKKLEERFPDLLDKEKGPALENAWRAYATSKGFSNEDLDSATDSRLFILLENSRKWEESERQKPKVAAKVERAVEAMKPSGTKPKAKPSEYERAKTQLVSSGRVEDAAVALNHYFKNKKE